MGGWISRLADAVRPGDRVRRRSPLIAVLLSVIPGLGQHYSGHIIRGIVAYVSLVVVSWLAAIAFMEIEGRWSLVLLAVPFVGVGLIAFDAYRRAARQPADYRLKWFNTLLIYIVVPLFLMVTVNPLMDRIVGQHIVRGYFATTSTMEPTVLKHDLLLVNKLGSPHAGDLVLVNLSRDQQSSSLTQVVEDQLIRRVVAVPGDTVEMRGSDVFVNGQKLAEPYRQSTEKSALYDFEDYRFGPTEVPEGKYFLLADKRGSGIDSQVLGFIEATQIEGLVTKIFWSWNFERGTIKWSRTAKSLR